MYAFRVVEWTQPETAEDSLEALLVDARDHLDNAEIHIRSIAKKNMEIARALNAEITRLRYQQRILERRSGIQVDANLGWIVPVIIGGSALVTTIGAWVWKQHKETEEIEKKADLFEQLTEQGVDPQEAAQAVLGGKSGVADVMSKAVLLAAIIAGVFVFSKLK